MSLQHAAALRSDLARLPVVRRIDASDLKAALIAGFADFKQTPTHLFFLALIYPVIGFVLTRVTMGEGLLPLAYPLIAGFALLGPFAAIGLYELSRRRELGFDASWRQAFAVLRSPSRWSIAVLGVVQLLIFATWMATAHALYVGLLGSAMPVSIEAFFQQLFGTPEGWALIVLGNAAGLPFAVLALTLSVVSFPLLVDRPIGASAAMVTSVRAVAKNPLTMALWGLIVAASLLAGSLFLLVGLALVVPILGHATWHLYRRVVVPVPDEGGPRP